ncbi:hybrid sensor histidine kinase/response regulator [bacterium]|nr:hybrid sensor histidine kinase/response regulator [bacterium]
MTVKRVLIVEDEAIVAKDLEFRLIDMGYEIVGSASTGSDAVQLATECHPDIILMDIHLRGSMDGIETARIIKETLDLPVVYLTAFADAATLDRAKLTDPFGYILKPFDERMLQISIEIAYHKYQSNRYIISREKWIESVLNSINSAVIATDPTGRISYINPAAESIVGVSKTSLLGEPLQQTLQFLDETMVPLRTHPVELTLHRGTPQVYDKMRLMVLGTESRWVNLSISALTDTQNTITGAVLGLKDITESIETRRALRSTQLTVDEKITAASKAEKRKLAQAQMRITLLETSIKELKKIERRYLRITTTPQEDN